MHSPCTKPAAEPRHKSHLNDYIPPESLPKEQTSNGQGGCASGMRGPFICTVASGVPWDPVKQRDFAYAGFLQEWEPLFAMACCCQRVIPGARAGWASQPGTNLKGEAGGNQNGPSLSLIIVDQSFAWQTTQVICGSCREKESISASAIAVYLSTTGELGLHWELEGWWGMCA